MWLFLDKFPVSLLARNFCRSFSLPHKSIITSLLSFAWHSCHFMLPQNININVSRMERERRTGSTCAEFNAERENYCFLFWLRRSYQRQMGHDLDTSGLDNGREWQSISELLPATLNCATSERSLPICDWRCHVSSEIFLMRSHFCRRNRFMFETPAAILFLIFLALIQTLSENDRKICRLSRALRRMKNRRTAYTKFFPTPGALIVLTCSRSAALAT